MISLKRCDDVIDVRPLTCVARIILRLPPVPVPGVGELLPRLVPPPPPREQLVPHPEPGRVPLNIRGRAPQIWRDLGTNVYILNGSTKLMSDALTATVGGSSKKYC